MDAEAASGSSEAGTLLAMPVRSSTIALVVTAMIVGPGCLNAGTPDDDTASGEAAEAEILVPVDTTPPTPFCAGIIELETRLVDAGDDVDTGALIIATYTELLPVAPPEIADDLAAIIAGESGQDESVTTEPPPDLGPDAPPGTDIDDPNEGFQPLATPAGRVATYIDSECDGVSSNPGPPPTVPFANTTTTAG